MLSGNKGLSADIRKVMGSNNEQTFWFTNTTNTPTQWSGTSYSTVGGARWYLDEYEVANGYFTFTVNRKCIVSFFCRNGFDSTTRKDVKSADVTYNNIKTFPTIRYAISLYNYSYYRVSLLAKQGDEIKFGLHFNMAEKSKNYGSGMWNSSYVSLCNAGDISKIQDASYYGEDSKVPRFIIKYPLTSGEITDVTVVNRTKGLVSAYETTWSGKGNGTLATSLTLKLTLARDVIILGAVETLETTTSGSNTGIAVVGFYNVGTSTTYSPMFYKKGETALISFGNIALTKGKQVQATITVYPVK